jgi:pSer/pThr/pTyr-binding forkhead associated (FHA) protein
LGGNLILSPCGRVIEPMGSLSPTASAGASALDWFRKSCGLGGPLVVRCLDARRTGVAEVAYQFDIPFVLVGRSAQSDLVLDDHRVSRRHAVIQAICGRLFCVDLESRTRLRWEQHDRPRTQGWLGPGQALRVGPFQIRGLAGSPAGHSDEGEDEWDPTLPGSRKPAAPGVRLELPIRFDKSKSSWRVEGRLAMVGRSDSNQLILSHENLSKFHAVFLRTPLGLWVVDLRARHGVLVNGIKVRWAWLDEGDHVKLGPFNLRVRYDARPGPLRRADVPLSAGSASESSSEVAGPSSPRGGAGTSLAIRGGSPAPGLPAIGSDFRDSALALLPRSAAWEPLPELVSHQAAMWQQQMQAMESFHKDMILMVQMFAAVHREHLRSVREELDQVRRLTKELSELQKDLVKIPAVRSRNDDSSGPGPSGPASVGSQTAPRPVAEGERSGPVPRPTNPEPDLAPLGDPMEGGAASRPSTGPLPKAPAVSSSKADEANDPSIHSALCQRIAAIQSERQGYWRKILGVISK